LHEQFVNGGIENAVENLLKLEKGKMDILAFSIGGTIAWKAALKGLDVKNLFAVSSTRLRYETKVPNCKIKLYFGEKDGNKPNMGWFEKHQNAYEIIEKGEHQMYLENDFASVIGEQILNESIA
jgi:hypothetical protein